MRIGLVSITFRKLTPVGIIELCRRCGLEYIEWGGDVHVPAGDIARAESIGQLTRDAGLHTACYGSYYRAGDGADCAAVLETAAALGAPLVRLWAGTRFDKSAAYVSAVARDISAAVKGAKKYRILISLECHRGTLTQEAETAVQLAEECGCLLHFQPNPDITNEENDAYLNAVLPYLSVFHVFAWDKSGVRLPLSAHADLWQRRITAAGDVPCLIEFVRGDDESQLLRDAETLRALTFS